MMMMKNRTAFAVAAGVWAAGAGLAWALTWELNRPLLEEGHRGSGFPPFAAALVAVGWLALVFVVFGSRRLRTITLSAPTSPALARVPARALASNARRFPAR
jgi:hypothetical protein